MNDFFYFWICTEKISLSTSDLCQHVRFCFPKSFCCCLRVFSYYSSYFWYVLTVFLNFSDSVLPMVDIIRILSVCSFPIMLFTFERFFVVVSVGGRTCISSSSVSSRLDLKHNLCHTSTSTLHRINTIFVLQPLYAFTR